MQNLSHSQHDLKIKNGISAFYHAAVAQCNGPSIVAIWLNSFRIYIYFLHKKTKNPTK